MPMATTKPFNAVPIAYYPGLQDLSIRSEVYEDRPLPIHVPLFMTFAAKGQTMGQYCNGGDALEHYGSEMFNYRSKYATIVTPFINLMNKYSNPYVIQRLRPKDAGPEANLCLAIEVIETDKLKEYERNSQGHFVYDPNNQRIPTTSEISGVVARWRLLNANTSVENAGLGKRQVAEGTAFYQNDPSVRGTIYPILEASASWFGEYGNNIGLRLFPIRNGDAGFDLNLMRDQGTCLYGIQVVKRESANSSPVIVRNNEGDKTTVVSFKPGAFKRNSGLSIDIDEMFLDSYRDFNGTGGRKYRYGDIGDIHVYQENIETVVKKMYLAERAANGDSVRLYGEEDWYVMNMLTGQDPNSRPYRAVEVHDALMGGDLSMKESSTVYLAGGSDGTMGDVVYDQLVREELLAFGDNETKYRDQGRYPIRVFYDVGFTPKTKEAAMLLLTKRQDVAVSLSVCDFVTGNKYPSIAEESSIGTSLTQMLRGIPESEEFGTPCYRANVIPSGGRGIHTAGYRKPLPATYQLAKWRAVFMGRGSMVKGQGYDAPPYNHVDELKEISNTYADAGVWERNWDQGMTHFRYKTDTIVFCPAVRTVYKDDTSVLTSDITMMATLDLNHFMFVLWTALTGNSKMDREEKIRYSNDKILQFAKDRYDDRFIIVPDTHYTQADDQRGYSWTCRINIYAKNMETQQRSYLVSHRIGDYNG